MRKFDDLSDEALDALVTKLVIKDERLRVAFNKSRNPLTGKRYSNARHRLNEARIAQRLRKK